MKKNIKKIDGNVFYVQFGKEINSTEEKHKGIVLDEELKDYVEMIEKKDLYATAWVSRFIANKLGFQGFKKQGFVVLGSSIALKVIPYLVALGILGLFGGNDTPETSQSKEQETMNYCTVYTTINTTNITINHHQSK